MRVGVLGPLVVGEGDVTTSPRGQRPRDLLAALLQRRGRPVAPEALLDQVWGDAAVGLTPAVVHTVVARLRRQLGAGLIDTHDAGYLVAVTTRTDEDEFVIARDDATRLTGAGDPGGAAAAYRRALGLWRTEVPYDGVRDDLVAADRARLVETRASVAESLVGLLLEHPSAGAPGEALDLALQLCATGPLREQAHRLAMTAAYQGGRQAQALELYALLRARLRRELGVEPAPETARVQARVLAHDPTLGQPAQALVRGRATVGGAAGRRRVAPVPMPAAPIVGRSAELAAVCADLESGHRLVTVHGPGGVGKTRLLRELGRHVGGPPGSVVYVDLAGVDARSVDELALTVLSAAGLPTGDQGPVESVVAAIGAAPLTLLVDEAEWSLEVVVPLVAQILQDCPQARAVVTSRVPLELVGERTLLLSPLACPPDRADAAGIRRAPAVALLLERLRDHAPDLELDDDDLTVVSRIARRVDGLPLALEIVAGHAATRSLRDLVELSEAPLDVPAGGRDRGPRHQSLRDTIAWSATRSTPDAQCALRRLGVFVGPVDPAAAAAVTALDPRRADAALRELVREGLLQVDRRANTGTRYRMLRTVRDLALDALAESGEAADARARHRQWFAAAWRSRPRSDELVRDVRDRHDDYLQALRSALEARDGAALSDLTLTLSRYWLFSNWNRPAITWVTRVLDAGVLNPADEARIRLQRACLALNVDPELTRSDATAALPVVAASGDLITLVTAHGTAALDANARGELDRALHHAHLAVSVARQTTLERTADALGMLAVVQSACGDAAGVLATAHEAGELLDRSGSSVARIAVCTNLSLALADVGHPTEALRALELAAAGMPQALGGDAPAYFDLTRGWVLLRCGTPQAALQAFARVLDDVSVGAADPTAVETYAGLAVSLAALGRPDGPALCAAAGQLADRVPTTLTPQQRTMVGDLAEAGAGTGEPTHALAARLDAALRIAMARHRDAAD